MLSQVQRGILQSEARKQTATLRVYIVLGQVFCSAPPSLVTFLPKHTVQPSTEKPALCSSYRTNEYCSLLVMKNRTPVSSCRWQFWKQVIVRSKPLDCGGSQNPVQGGTLEGKLHRIKDSRKQDWIKSCFSGDVINQKGIPLDGTALSFFKSSHNIAYKHWTIHKIRL